MKLENQAIDDLHQLALALYKLDRLAVRRLNARYAGHVKFLCERIRKAPRARGGSRIERGGGVG